jgi:CubicO group peptidase (beta-lactamase class C family)
MVIRRRTFLGGMLLLPAAIAACEATTPPADRPAGESGGKPLPAEAWQALAEELQQRAAAGAFSGTVLVANHGKALLQQGYGLADRQRGLANTAQTKFPIASLGKMFTAVAVAQLAQQHRLAFTDTIGTHLAGFPPEIAGRVTVHQLLTHTAGMGDAALRGPSDRSRPPHTLAGLLGRIVKAPLQFQPGSRFSYSNDGFIVLGAIIERLTRQRYADYLRKHVFAPAGMAATDIGIYKPSQVPGMAHGYMLVGKDGRPVPSGPGQGSTTPSGALRENDEVQVGNPSGGAWSTVGDLLSFAQALTGHRLLSPAMTDTVLAGKVATNRPGPGQDRYAYGFADQQINGVRIVGHNGGTPGYEAQLDIYSDRGYVVVMLTNQDQVLTPVLRQSEELLTWDRHGSAATTAAGGSHGRT